MAASSLNNEFKKYWSLLTTGQKKSVIKLIQSFTKPDENNQHVQEEAVEYETAFAAKEENIFEQLSDKEKFSVMILIKTFLKGDEQNPEEFDIELYNQQLKEAEEEYQRGDFISHEEMLKLIRQW